MRLPRVLSVAALSAAMSAPLFVSPAARGQPAPGDAPPPLAQPVAKNPLVEQAENFWHYSKIAKYDLAAEEAKKVVASGAPAADILVAFENVAADRRDDLYATLYRWSSVEAMREPTQALIAKLKEGQAARYADPKWIRTQVERLSINEQAFENAIGELRQSGEFAAPIMVDVLRNANDKKFHSSTRRAIVRLGRQVLNPLVATTEAKDPATLTTMIGILGDLGYPAAVPYILRVYQSDQPGRTEVKSAAALALSKLGVADPARSNTAAEFYDLGEKFYYENVSITPDPRFPEVAHVWYWDETKGLDYKDVPPVVFNEVMAKRSCEYALRLDPGRGDAVSLWLAANNKREAELPEGKQDPTHTSGMDAHFYNVALGTQYCTAVLDRALRDRTPAVALKVIRSLQEIVGQANVLAGNQASAQEPIIRAMQFPDRLVRFEAAMTLAAALPQKSFDGQQLVVPTLAEAIAATGKPNVLVVTSDQNTANALRELIKDAVKSEAAGDATSATEAAGRMPSVDVVILDSRNNKESDAVLSGPRVRGVPKVIIVENKASPYVNFELNNELVNTISAGTGQVTGDQLVQAIEKARKRAGNPPLDDKTSEAYAKRAATLLHHLAINRGQVLDISAAQGTLVRGLDDGRVEIAKECANVLGLIETKEAQSALAIKGADEKAPDDVKVAAFKGVAVSARFFGNQLDSNLVEALQKVVEASQSPAVRSAAAEAQGALNLSPDRAKNLILQQSPVGK